MTIPIATNYRALGSNTVKHSIHPYQSSREGDSGCGNLISSFFAKIAKTDVMKSPLYLLRGSLRGSGYQEAVHPHTTAIKVMGEQVIDHPGILADQEFKSFLHAVPQEVLYSVYIYICIHIYTCTYMHTYTHTYTHMHTPVHVDVRIHVHQFIYIYISFLQIHHHEHVRMYIYIYTFTHAYIRTYMHAYIHTYRDLQGAIKGTTLDQTFELTAFPAHEALVAAFSSSFVTSGGHVLPRQRKLWHKLVSNLDLIGT